MAGYRSLSSDKTLETIELLGHRIEERFPKSNLKGVFDSLLEVAQDSKAKAAWIARPNYPLRVGIGLVIVVGMATLGISFQRDQYRAERFGLSFRCGD